LIALIGGSRPVLRAAKGEVPLVDLPGREGDRNPFLSLLGPANYRAK
jgi:hypothetical protein